MLTGISLLSCVFTLGQTPERSQWLLVPQYAQGLELLYTGTYSEKSLIPGVEHRREYRLENSIFVLSSTPRSWEVAVMTVLGYRPVRQAQEGPQAATSSVRLEIGEVSKTGNFRGQREPLVIPLTGPPTLESGVFVEFPAGRIGKNQTWEVTEPGRPPRSWQLAGLEARQGTTCFKLIGLQQSDDWDRPRADSTAWRRRDSVWIIPQLGIPCRVERTLERRDPARRSPTHISEVHYDLSEQFRYTGRFFDDRQQEIQQSRRFVEEGQTLAQKPNTPPAFFDRLLRKISYHLDQQTPTPYRQAVLQVQRTVEKAKRGELILEPAQEELPAPLAPLKAGQRVPDFIVSEMTGNQVTRFYRLLGRPTLMLYYNPAADTGWQVLKFAQKLQERYRTTVSVMPMAVSRDVELVRRQHKDMQLPFPIYDGQAMRLTFGVDATPRCILLDGDGVVRGTYTGWAFHVLQEIETDLQNWLSRR